MRIIHGLYGNNNQTPTTQMTHLCKVKILRVCLLSSQSDRDQDDDSSVVRQT